jgi:3'-phosphoadenosine 5'-phosphosulfate sulfotransferase (PAPS reductase)/FAD synthetase
MNEPILTDEDIQAWAVWQRVAATNAKTSRYKFRRDRAIAAVEQFASVHPCAIVSWSGGKDSTCVAHMVRVLVGINGPVMSIRDDVDYPDTVPYMERLATAWQIDVDYVTPPFSVKEWVRDHINDAASDFHSNTSFLATASFYDLVKKYAAERGLPGTYLGLRADESKGRRMNRAMRGLSYLKRDGEAICQPIADWQGIDVFSYLWEHGIEVLPRYRACADRDPTRIREDGWLVGIHALEGEMCYLRRYYPSLYREMCAICPTARRYT